MKRKTLKKGLMLLVVSTFSVSMLSGCSLLKPTTQSLLRDCSKKMANVKDMGLDAEIKYALELSKDGASVEMDFTADADLAYEKINDGYETYMDADMKISLMGISKTVNGEVYTVVEDEKVTTYSKSEDQDEWMKEEEKLDEDSFGIQSLANSDFSNLADSMTLMENTEEVHGRECYVLKGVVENSNFSDVLGDMDLDDLGDMDNLKAEVTLNLDKQDKMPVSIIMEVDEDEFNKVLENADLEGVSISIDELTIEMVYKEINTGKTVDTPAEVYDAVEKEDSDGTLDLFGDLDEEDEDNDDSMVEPVEDEDGEIVEPEDEEDDDNDNDGLSTSYGKGNMNLKEFKAEGFEFQEFVQKADEKIYVRLVNGNKKALTVSVYASFMKDGEVVDEDFDFLEFEPNTYQVTHFNIDTDYDSVEYTFEVDETTTEYNGTQMDVFYVLEGDTVSGIVTNESSSSAKYVEVHVVLYDENGEIIEHNDTFVEDDVVAPSEQSKYTMYIDHTDYHSYEIYANAYAE